jgi:hypothetical protein
MLKKTYVVESKVLGIPSRVFVDLDIGCESAYADAR